MHKTINLSVVIPSYNAASWLPKSILRLDLAIRKAGFSSAEILIINDGSTDETIKVAEKIKTSTTLKIITQKNSGRFLARKLGTEKAKYEYILFIDTRIYIAESGLKFIVDEIRKNPERVVWTSHVYLYKKGNIYARFWDAITSLAWRKYFSNPRDISYGIKDFDKYPKGTTCFFTPKYLVKEANEWFLENTKDLKTSNDDTLLIRRIAEQVNININPKFNCTYHARTSFRQYIKHVHHRGKVFVDGFLRRDGNIYFWFILLFLLATVVAPILLIIFPGLVVPFILGACATWLISFLSMLVLGINYKDALSFFILLPAFFISYGLGIWVATYSIFIKRSYKQVDI